MANLVESLKTRSGLKSEDVYHHADISYKDKKGTEGKGLGPGHLVIRTNTDVFDFRTD